MTPPPARGILTGLLVFLQMRYRVTVKPNQKFQRIEKTPEGFLAFLKSPAREGKANQELIKALARTLDIAQSRITITSGLKSKIKVVEVK